WLFRTMRQPACAVAAMPSMVGRLPTTTQPPCRISSAVVRPTPPRQEPSSLAATMCANTLTLPRGETWTIVIPVPCRFLRLLKLANRELPLKRHPRLPGAAPPPIGLAAPVLGEGGADGR